IASFCTSWILTALPGASPPCGPSVVDVPSLRHAIRSRPLDSANEARRMLAPMCDRGINRSNRRSMYTKNRAPPCRPHHTGRGDLGRETDLRLRRKAHELDERHRRRVALANPGLQQAGVAALAAREVRADLGEQPAKCRLGLDCTGGHAM